MGSPVPDGMTQQALGGGGYSDKTTHGKLGLTAQGL